MPHQNLKGQNSRGTYSISFKNQSFIDLTIISSLEEIHLALKNLILIHSQDEDSQAKGSNENDIIPAVHKGRTQKDEADILQNYVPLVAQMASCIIE